MPRVPGTAESKEDPGHTPEANKFSRSNFLKLAGKWKERTVSYPHAQGVGPQYANLWPQGCGPGPRKCIAGSSPTKTGL